MKYFKLGLIMIVSICLLSACGGGGGGGGGGSTTNAAVPASVTPLVSELITIPDPVSFYSYACDDPSIQHVIPVNINNDNRDDFIIHYWCDRPDGTWGDPYNDPTPDALVVQLSQPNGTYEVSNIDVFNNEHVGLGGASRKYVRGDLNKDGKDDFAFAMNYEDGRSGSDWNTVKAQPTVLMSTDTGYEVVRLGNADWGHSVGIANNNDGTSEVYFTGFTGVGIQAFRYVDGRFVDVSDTYPVDGGDWAYGVRSINDDNDITQYIISSATVADPDAEMYTVLKRGAALFKRINGVWTETSTFYYDAEFIVDFVTPWTYEVIRNTIFTVNDRKVILYGFDMFHVMKGGLSGYDEDIIVGKMAGVCDRTGNYIEGETYRDDNSEAVQIYQFFNISGGKLTLVDTPVVNEITNVTFNFFEIKDITGDDYPDLISYAFTTPWNNSRVEEAGKPVIYLNNRNGQLVKTDISGLPGYVEDAPATGLINDVDHDGIADMILFGLRANDGDGTIRSYILNDFIN